MIRFVGKVAGFLRALEQEVEANKTVQVVSHSVETLFTSEIQHGSR